MYKRINLLPENIHLHIIVFFSDESWTATQVLQMSWSALEVEYYLMMIMRYLLLSYNLSRFEISRSIKMSYFLLNGECSSNKIFNLVLIF